MNVLKFCWDGYGRGGLRVEDGIGWVLDGIWRGGKVGFGFGGGWREEFGGE